MVDDVVTPAARLFNALKERGMTQDELAALTGISRVTINGYVNGRLGIGPKNGPRMARALALPEDHFNGHDKLTSAQFAEAVGRLDRTLEDVLKRLAALERRRPSR